MLRHEIRHRAFDRRAAAVGAMGSGARYSSTGRSALPDRAGQRARTIGPGYRGAVVHQPQYRDFVAQAFLCAAFGRLWKIAPGRGRKPIYDMGKISAIVTPPCKPSRKA